MFDSLDKPNPTQKEDVPYAAPRPAGTNWRALVPITLIGFGAMVLTILALQAFLKDLYRDNEVFQVAVDGTLIVVVIVVACIAIAIALRLLIWATTITQPGGFKVNILQQFSLDMATLLLGVVDSYKAHAGRQFPVATTVTLTNQSKGGPEAMVIEGEATVADEGLALVPADTWLPWLLEQPHAMLAGSTGAGKTTFARVVLGERLRGGYQAIVIDPKGKEWFGLPVVGGGRKFDEMLATLDAIRSEMDRRFTAYGAGERSFEPLAVLVDEVPDIMDACLDDKRRLKDPRWVRFVRQLGSLAREVNISVTLMTQSPLVEDIGMNSAMRKNFSRIALGDEAPNLIREERETLARKGLQQLLKGQSHPAALYRCGSVYLLDTSTVPALAQRSVGPVVGWQPRLLNAPPVDARSVMVKLLGQLRNEKRMTREQARVWCEARGLRFDNALWTLADQQTDES